MKVALRLLGSSLSNAELHSLGPQPGMSCDQMYRSCLLPGTYPDCAGSTNKRKRIVADDLRGAVQLKLDGIIREGPDCTKLVGDAHDNAGRIGAIGDQFHIVRGYREPAVNACPRHFLFGYFPVADVAFDS